MASAPLFDRSLHNVIIPQYDRRRENRGYSHSIVAGGFPEIS